MFYYAPCHLFCVSPNYFRLSVEIWKCVGNSELSIFTINIFCEWARLGNKDFQLKVCGQYQVEYWQWSNTCRPLPSAPGEEIEKETGAIQGIWKWRFCHWTRRDEETNSRRWRMCMSVVKQKFTATDSQGCHFHSYQGPYLLFKVNLISLW